MTSSSGIDGAYLARMMAPQLWFLGYVLNTVSDVSGMILMYWFGKLRQERKGSKRHRLALALLPAEVIAIAYSWFFSWLQLRMVLRPIEGADAQWVAPIAAGFIPLLLAFIGWAQALREGRFQEPVAETAASETPAITTAPPLTAIAEDVQLRIATMQDWRAIIADRQEGDVQVGVDGVKILLMRAGLAAPSERTLYNWARMTRNDKGGV